MGYDYFMSNKSTKEAVRKLWIARDQFARHLHDGPAQSISAVAMRLNIAKRLIGEGNSKTIEELNQAEEQTRLAAKEMRYLLFATQAKSLRTAGLAAGLQDLAEQTQDTFGVEVHLDVDVKSGKKLDEENQSLLFLLALEAITVARKHNAVNKISLRMNFIENDLLLLEVHDDGDPNQVASEALEELVRLIEGDFDNTAGDDNDNQLQIWIPLSLAAVKHLHKKS